MAGDYRDVDLAPGAQPLIFLPYGQLPLPVMTRVVRTRGAAPAAVATGVRTRLRSPDPNLPVPETRPLERSPSRAVAGPRFRTALLGAVGVLAGVVPAHRATRVDPAVALRAE